MTNKHPGTALITGGARRIGKEIAVSLAALGYTIALHCHRSAQDAEDVANQIKNSKGRCEIFPADLEDTVEAQAVIPNVLKRFHRLDLLVNNASIFEKSSLRSSNPEVFDHHMAVNLRAPYILMAEFARVCQNGHIINILDTNIMRHRITHAAYLISKKALAELSAMAAVEFAPHIRVNAVAPGLILPPEGENEGYLAARAEAVPLRRQGTPGHVAHAVRFLIENDYLTGQTIFVDGGEHLI